MGYSDLLSLFFKGLLNNMTLQHNKQKIRSFLVFVLSFQITAGKEQVEY